MGLFILSMKRTRKELNAGSKILDVEIQELFGQSVRKNEKSQQHSTDAEQRAKSSVRSCFFANSHAGSRSGLYLEKWLISNGNWVDEGLPLYQIKIVLSGSRYYSPPLVATTSGII